MAHKLLSSSVMDGENITCKIEGKKLLCNGIIYVEEEEPLTYTDEWFWIYLGIYVGLVLLAGLVSGLTMGLLSLDMMSLNVLANGGKPKERKYAARIIPIIKRHHLLLVSLLLTNAAAVESMPLFLDRISNPVTAIVVSVTAVLIFGEVVPQAICTRYGLAIGANLSPLVIFLMVITLPVSWPLSKLLDCVLGTEHGTFFRRAELGVLVDLHQTDAVDNEDPLSPDEVLIIKGVLSMREKRAKQACTPLKSIYAIDINGVMDEQTMEEILQTGHSRIPVYESNKTNLIGVLLVKRLIKLDPEERIPIRSVFDTERRDLPKISENCQLFDLLNQFQLGKSHMCCVTRAQSGDVIGIITLEDVIEEMIQEEILDETDLDVMQSKRAVAVRRMYLNSVSRDGRSSGYSKSSGSRRDSGRGLNTTDQDSDYANISDSDTKALLS